jgi:hypothetical protein
MGLKFNPIGQPFDIDVVGAAGTGGGNVYAGNNISLSTNGASTTVSVVSTNFASVSHTHNHSNLSGLDDDRHPRVTNLLSTGIIDGGELSINADPTKFDIAAGYGLIVDNHTDPLNPTRTLVNWSAKTAQTDTYLATSTSTYIAIDSSGNVVQSDVNFTDSQRRDYIILGTTSHIVGDVIESADLEPYESYNVMGQVSDFFENFGAFNIEGNEYNHNSALAIEKTAGKTFDAGSNYVNSVKSPNVVISGAESPVADIYYYYRNTDWVNDTAPVGSIDPNQYDTGTGLSAVPTDYWTVQTVFFYAPWGTTDVQYGQAYYATREEAEAAVSATIEINPWIADWDTFRCWLVVQEGSTDLTDPAQATFLSAGKLGLVSSVSGGGSAGESNTASNIGNSGVGVYVQKVGVDLQFKNIASVNNHISISNDTVGNNIKVSLIPGNIDITALSNTGVFQTAGAYLTTARASNDAIGLVTAGTNVTWTANSAGLSLNAGGYAGTGTTFNGANISGSLTQNSNGIQMSMSVAAGGAGFTGGLSNIGNTLGDTGTVSNRMILAGGNNITLSQSTDAGGATITISSPNTVAQSNQNMSLYALGNTTQNSSTLLNASNMSFNAIGSLTVGYSNGSIQFSAPNALTTQSGQAFSAGAASSAFQTLSFQDSNGVSFSNNAGAIRVTHDLQFTSATSAITANALNTSASRVMNILAATNNTGGGTASLSSNVSFSNANNISFYTSAGNAIVGSVNTSYRASNDAVGLNTAQSNATWTVNSSGISFDGRGYAGTGTTFNGANISGSLTQNSNGIQMSMSVAAGGGVNPVASASNGSFSFTTLNFSNANNVTFGTSAGSIITASVAAPGAAAENNWFNLLGANTAGNTTASGSTIGVSGINLTLSGTNGSVWNISAPATSSLSATGGIKLSTNGSTISIGMGNILSDFRHPENMWTSLGAQGQGSLSIKHMYAPFNITGTAMKIGGSLSAATNTSATTASANISLWMGIYTLNGSSLSLASSGSANNGFQWSLSASTTANTSIQSMRQMTVPMNVNMTPGEYWVAAVISSATTYTSAGFTLYGGNLINNAASAGVFAPIGSGTTASSMPILFQGIYTAATSVGPSSMSKAHINWTSASNLQRANFYNQILNNTY